VVLTSFREGPTTNSSSSQVSKEFIPRNSRPCNAIAWNPVYKNQLAAGLGKVRCDFSTLVWDVHQIGRKIRWIILNYWLFIISPGPAITTASARASGGEITLKAAETVMRPMGEVNMSEATVALAWVPGQPSCLATGTGAKWLRIYDLRASDLSARKSVLAHSKVYYYFFTVKHAHITVFCKNRVYMGWRSILSTTKDYPHFQMMVNTTTRSPPCQQHTYFFPSLTGIVKVWDIRKLREPISYTTTPPFPFFIQHIRHSLFCLNSLSYFLCKRTVRGYYKSLGVRHDRAFWPLSQKMKNKSNCGTLKTLPWARTLTIPIPKRAFGSSLVLAEVIFFFLSQNLF